LEQCDLKALSLTADVVQAVLQHEPYYLSEVRIPSEMLVQQYEALETVATATTLVTSRAVSGLVVSRVLASVFDNFYALQALYLPALGEDLKSDPDKIAHGGRSAPLHMAAWRYFTERGFVAEPRWVVLGAFEQWTQAQRLARLLAQRYPDSFPRGLQARIATVNDIALIAGDAMTPAQANRRLKELSKLKVIRDPYTFPALSDWSEDLLPLPPRIYSHVVDAYTRGQAEKVKSVLEREGWHVTESQVVKSRPGSSQLRYFRHSDELIARRILRDMESAGVKVRLKYIPGYETTTSIRPLHFELWFTDGHADGSKKRSKAR